MRAAAVLLALLSVDLLAADGDLDAAFGTAGMAVSGLNRFVSSSPAVIQADGKIVLCGSRYDPSLSRTIMYVVRFQANGALDMGFGNSGHVTVAFGSGPGNDTCSATAIQTDGRIVVAGSSSSYAVSGYDFAITRLLPDGATDPAFAPTSNGRTRLGFDIAAGSDSDDFLNDMALQGDGRIVLAGSAGNRSRFAAARLDQGGVPDASFSGDGKLVFAIPMSGNMGGAAANAVRIAPDGRIVLAGYSYNAQNNGSNGQDFAVARLMADGSPDPGFGSGGYTSVGFDLTGAGGSNDDVVLGMILQRNDRILLLGSAGLSSINGIQNARSAARLLPSGAVDTTFGEAGKRFWPLSNPSGPSDDSLRAAMEQSDGKIVLVAAVGYVGYAVSVMRVDQGGNADASFGTGGVKVLDFGMTAPSFQVPRGVQLPAGEILVSGLVSINDGGENNCCRDLLVTRLFNALIFKDAFEEAY